MTLLASDINWNDYVYYDETSPSFLRWKVDRFRGTKLTSKFISKDDIAGTTDKQKYWRIKFKGRNWACHRIIMMLFGKYCENFEVDHIDHDRSNNNINNLRTIPSIHNKRNLSKFVTNKSGVTGVNWKVFYRKCSTTTYAVASWRNLDGKQINKYFPVNKHGLLEAFALAVRCRKEMIAILNEDGASYTNNHGM